MPAVAKLVHHGKKDQGRRAATHCQVAQEAPTSVVRDGVQRFSPRLPHGLVCTARHTDPSRGASQCPPILEEMPDDVRNIAREHRKNNSFISCMLLLFCRVDQCLGSPVHVLNRVFL